jgi:hypothetical protein
MFTIIVFELRLHDASFARANQVSRMRVQTFHTSFETFDALNFEASYDFHYSTCIPGT